MKVLMLTWEYPPQISGGLGVACQGIVDSLSKKGIEFNLLLPERPSALGSYRTMLDEVQQFRSWAAGQSFKQSYDLIHAHDWLTILAGLEIKKVSGKPLIFHIHSLEIDRSGDNVNSAIVDIEKIGLEQSDKIIAVSNFTKQRIIKYFGVPAEKITISYNGLSNIHCKNSHPQSTKILFMGRITHQKGPYFFLKSAQQIHTKRPETQFIMAGTGDQMNDMILLSAQMRMGSYIHFPGFLNREEIERIFAESSIFVMPSVSEPFGIACLEAIAAGLPVIISKDAGVCEVLPHLMTVDHWDTDKIASQVITLLDNPVLGSRMVSNAQQILGNLTWDNTTEPILATYRALCPRSV